MADVVGKMAIQVSATDKGLKQTLQRTQKATKQTAQAFDKMKTKSRGLSGAMKKVQASTKKLKKAMATGWKKIPFKKMLAGAGAFLGARALVQKFMSTIKKLDKMGKVGAKLGIHVPALGELGYAAQRAGIETNTLEMGLQRMTRRVSEAALGTGEAQGALKELGLSAAQLTQMSPDKQLHMIAEAFKNITSPAERVRLAMKLFDSEGVAMVNMLRDGSAGLTAMGARYTALTGQISTTEMEDFSDAMLDLQTAFDGAWMQIAQKLAPAMSEFFEDMPYYVDLTGRVTDALQLMWSLSPASWWFGGRTSFSAITEEELARLEKLHGIAAMSAVDDKLGPVTEEHIRLLQVTVDTLKERRQHFSQEVKDGKDRLRDLKAVNDEYHKMNKHLEKRKKQLQSQTDREAEEAAAAAQEKKQGIFERRLNTETQLADLHTQHQDYLDNSLMTQDEYLAKLQFEADILDQQLNNTKLTAEEYDKLHKKRIANEREFNSVRKKQDQEIKREVEQEFAEQERKAKKWRESFKTDFDKFTEKANELHELWKNGLLSQEEYNQGMQTLLDENNEGFEELAKAARGAADAWVSAADKAAEESFAPAIEAGSVAAMKQDAKERFMKDNPFGTVDKKATQQRADQLQVLQDIRDKLDPPSGGGGTSITEVGI